jgi:hypothetical protein
MTRRCVTDEQYGKLWRKLNEVARRTDEGTIDFEDTLGLLQYVIEPRLPHINVIGKFDVSMFAGVSLEQLVRSDLFLNWDMNILEEKNHFDDYPIEGARTRVTTLIQHFDLPTSNKRGIESLRRKGLRPLSGKELLFLVNTRPYRVKNMLQMVNGYSIIALGSNWSTDYHRQSRKYLKLGVEDKELILILEKEPANGWPTNHLFAGFPI